MGCSLCVFFTFITFKKELPRAGVTSECVCVQPCSENGGISPLDDGLPDFYTKRVLPDRWHLPPRLHLHHLLWHFYDRAPPRVRIIWQSLENPQTRAPGCQMSLTASERAVKTRQMMKCFLDEWTPVQEILKNVCFFGGETHWMASRGLRQI